MPSSHFVHPILLSSGQKVPKVGPFKNEGIHEVSVMSGGERIRGQEQATRFCKCRRGRRSAGDGSSNC